MQRIRIEFILMLTAISITGWHVYNYFSVEDGPIFAAVQGVGMSAIVIYLSHGLFRDGVNRTPFLLGLSFFVVTSIMFQYRHFVPADDPFDAEMLLRASWGPVAELILGWCLAAVDAAKPSAETAKPSTGTRFAVLGDALINRAVSSIETPKTAPAQITPVASTAIEDITEPETQPSPPERKTTEDVDAADIVDAYRRNPGASYQTIANALGVSKSFIGKRVPGMVEDGALHRNGNGVTVRDA